jgi:hypothetical protein
MANENTNSPQINVSQNDLKDPGLYRLNLRLDLAQSTAITAQQAAQQALKATAAVTSTLAISFSGSTGIIGVVYGGAFTATGGSPPYIYSASGLPPGLSLNTSTGIIFGTPTTVGPYAVSGSVTDTAGNIATISCTIVISAAVSSTPLQISFAGSAGLIGLAYQGALIATGGVSPYTYSLASGSLPTSLSLSASTGAITGNPTVSGTFTFVGQVTDHASATATTASCTIVINGPPTQPSSIVLTDTGIRTLDQNQTTYATLQMVVKELMSGVLSTILNLEFSLTNRVASLPSLPNPNYPAGIYVYLTSSSQYYQNQSGTWVATATGGWTAIPSSPTVVPDRVDNDGTHYLTTVLFQILVQTSAQSIQVGAYGANQYANPGATVATLSNILTVPIAASPIAGGATITVTNVGGSSPTPANIYMGANGLGNPYWAVAVSLTTPLQGDPNCAFYQLCVEWTDSSGNPINPGGVSNTSGFNKNIEVPNTGATFVEPSLEGNYPGPGVDGYLKFSIWGLSRDNTVNSPPYTGDSTATLQTSTFLLHVGPPPTGNSNNMLVNPSAIQGLVGWTPDSTGTYSTVSNSSLGFAVQCFQIVASGVAGLYQTFTVRPADNYIFEIWAAVTAGAGSGTTEMRLIFLNASGGVVSSATLNLTSLLTSTLQPFSLTGTVPNNAVSMQASVDTLSGTSSTIIFTNSFLVSGVAAPLTKSGNTTTLAMGAGLSTVAGQLAVNITTGNAATVVAALALVDSLIASVGLNKLAAANVTQGTAIFTGDAIFSRGSGNPLIDLSSSGMTLYSTAASGGGSGLVSSPYMSLTGSGITIASSFGGANNYSVIISSSSIQMVYNGTAYITLNTSGITLASGGSSVTITSSSVAIVQGTLSLILNGITTSIANYYDSYGAGYAGFKCLDNSTGAYVGIRPFELFLLYSTTKTVDLYTNAVSGGQAGRLLLSSTATPSAYADLKVDAGSGILYLYDGTHVVNLNGSAFVHQGLPSSDPGSGTKQLWYDPSDSNRVKYAA